MGVISGTLALASCSYGGGTPKRELNRARG